VEAVSWNRKAAQQGHRGAQFQLAERYAQGTGVAKDTTEAIKWYRKAADGGPADIQLWVATRFWDEVRQPGCLPADPQECLKWLKKSAEQGNGDAQKMLGRIYQKGELLAKDESEGAKWLRKAAEQGSPTVSKWRKAAEQGEHRAAFELGELYANGEWYNSEDKVEKDVGEAIKWYRKAADGGPAELQFWVAVRFWNPSDSTNFTKTGTSPVPRHYQIPADPQECLKWLLKSAEQGHGPAQDMLARIYEAGELLPKNEAERVRWLRKYCDYQSALPLPSTVASGGEPDPTSEEVNRMLNGGNYCTLARQYERGDVVPKDEREALKWYRKAAALGDWGGQWNVGRMLEEGKGTATDPTEAAKWYRKAADQGRGYYQTLSQMALGKMYAEGRGVPLDGSEAIKWYKKAADTDSVDALVGIAEVWAFGKGVPKSTAEAAKWYKQAAERGNPVSKFNLGVFYLKGEGVPLDYIEAYKWFNLAAADGYERAAELRDSLPSRMTREQIAEAQRRASEFLTGKRSGNQSGGGKNSTPADTSLAAPKASGSGFFITEDGYLLSNAHVVEGAARLVVKTKLGAFPAVLVRVDAINDIAVLKASGAFRPLPITPSRVVKLGDSVITVGFPNPALQGVEPKLTDGRISSLAGVQDDARYFQISVAVQPGNSGGALVNSVGNVVGIVTARLSDKAALETSGALPQNVNYAIKGSYVLSLLESLPDVASRLKEPWPARERKFEDVAKEAQDAAVLVLVY
jgi:TPR repeat protein